MGNVKRKQRTKEIQAVENGNSSSRLKKKIRDLQRLLKKPGLAATKAEETERALTALKYQLDNAKDQNQIKQMAKKYHMVRFFEKKKAMRKLKQAAASSKPDKLRQAEIDYYYVTTFPIDKKYVSLFPSEDADLSKQLRSEYRAEVERQIEAGQLVCGLDESGRSKALKADEKRDTRKHTKSKVASKQDVKHDDRSEEGEEEEEQDEFFD